MKPINIYKLTPAQIALADRLATSANGVLMDALDYREIVTWQELDKLGMADMQVGKRRKAQVVLTDLGAQVRANGYLSRKPVVRLTGPQIAALRFLAGRRRHFNDIPATMIDVCRRMYLRGWVEWDDDRFATVTKQGRQIVLLVDVGNENS